MKSFPVLVKFLVAAALLSAGAVSHAAVSFYDSKAAFLAVVGQTGTDEFDDLRFVDGPNFQLRQAGSFNYAVGTEGGSAIIGFHVGNSSDYYLAPGFSDDTLLIGNFTGVRAVGGNFFNMSYRAGVYPGTEMVIDIFDVQGTATRSTFISGDSNSFTGFVSSADIDYIAVHATEFDTDFAFGSVNNLILATAVPEPSTYGMLLGGLALLGVAARRRQL